MNVEAVNLRREGGEDDPLARVVVSMKVNGEWREVINELAGNNFDHYVNLDLLFKASLPSPATPDAATYDTLRAELLQNPDTARERVVEAACLVSVDGHTEANLRRLDDAVAAYLAL
jgi:hypothetical protein